MLFFRKIKLKKKKENDAHSVPLFTRLGANGRYPSRSDVKQLQHKCAALPRQIAIFVFFVRTTQERKKKKHSF